MGPFHKGWTEADIDAALQRGDPEELLYVPIVLGMNAPDCERGWVEGICFHLATHHHFNVRGNAILGLGHVARTCGALDTETAVSIIARALTDESEFVRGQAQCAADDLETYLGVKVTGDR